MVYGRKGDKEETETKQNDLQDAASDQARFNIKSWEDKTDGCGLPEPQHC